MNTHKLQVVRSVKLDEREVSGIYDTPTSRDKTIIDFIEDDDDTIFPEHGERPTQDEPMECPDELVEDTDMQELDDQESSRLKLTLYPRIDSDMVFRPQLARARCSQEPVLMFENGLELDDDKVNDHFYPPSSKRLRFDDNCLPADAVLPYAANIKGTDDGPETYQEAVASDASNDIKAMEEELKAHKGNVSWVFV